MFVIRTLAKGPPLRISLEGIIDESANFSTLLENPGIEIHVFCQKVARINSIGVKIWTDSFSAFRKTNGKLKFFEITSDLIESMNYISSFILDDELGTLSVPYYCEKCKRTSVETLTPQQIQEQFKTLGTKPCPHCKGIMEIECDPEDFFISICKSTLT